MKALVKIKDSKTGGTVWEYQEVKNNEHAKSISRRAE